MLKYASFQANLIRLVGFVFDCLGRSLSFDMHYFRLVVLAADEELEAPSAELDAIIGIIAFSCIGDDFDAFE